MAHADGKEQAILPTLRTPISRRSPRSCELIWRRCATTIQPKPGWPMNYSTDFKSIRDQVSPQEWQTRLDLAACYRLVNVFGMTDLIYNHITARIPGSSDHLLINLYGLLYKEITASSLVKNDVEGEVIWKPDTHYGSN